MFWTLNFSSLGHKYVGKFSVVALIAVLQPTIPLYLSFGKNQKAAWRISKCSGSLMSRKASETAGMINHARNPSTQDTEAGGLLWVWSEPSIRSESQSSLSYSVGPLSEKKREGKKLTKGSANNNACSISLTSWSASNSACSISLTTLAQVNAGKLHELVNERYTCPSWHAWSQEHTLHTHKHTHTHMLTLIINVTEEGRNRRREGTRKGERVLDSSQSTNCIVMLH